MKIAYIAAGAAGMYCGACIHDNTLATALAQLGHDVPLIPTYTPTRTDEANVSLPRVFFGGINVFLQQRFALFRHTPWWLDRVFDSPSLLRLASRLASRTNPAELGELTVSMLRGEGGNQRKELRKLIAWLKQEVRPQIVCLTNALLAGMAREIKRELRVPVVCGLPGEDLFLDGLPEPSRSQARALLRERCGDVDAFIAMSRYYADFMAEILGVSRERIHVVRPGLNLEGYGEMRSAECGVRNEPVVIGYFARLAPEKGLHLLCEAYRLLRQMPGVGPTRLRAGGYLGEAGRVYLEKIQRDMAAWGLAKQFDYVGELDRAGKIGFLRSLDMFSMPTTYREPKGLPVLEALACGVPFVEPAHGVFPELAEVTGGGLVVKPDDPRALAEGLARLVADVRLREELGRRGRDAVRRDFTAERMAEQTLEIFRRILAKQ
ncbi:MAG: glycosyltransferase family 4 protein [Verrucomicrobia bacterium]|nr:glycosyltransferase family 4 protein [Verrucomicrobiota bacterium]